MLAYLLPLYSTLVISLRVTSRIDSLTFKLISPPPPSLTSHTIDQNCCLQILPPSACLLPGRTRGVMLCAYIISYCFECLLLHCAHLQCVCVVCATGSQSSAARVSLHMPLCFMILFCLVNTLGVTQSNEI